jgi:hypothetical protein
MGIWADALQFYFLFVLAGIFHRFITMKLLDKDHPFAKALAFVH